MGSFSSRVRIWPSREPAVCAKMAMPIAGHPSCLPTSGFRDSADESKSGSPFFAKCFHNDLLFNRRTTSMPMIDLYAPTDLFPVSADRQLAEELTAALLKAEGVANPGPTHTNKTGAYIHRMPPSPRKPA